jgi:hypothetical protein
MEAHVARGRPLVSVGHPAASLGWGYKVVVLSLMGDIHPTMISAAVLALLAGCSTVFAVPSVSVSFTGEKTVTDVDNFKVVVKVTNSGDETLTLLDDPRTLLTPDWNTETFHITNSEGVVPEFKGVAVSGRDTFSNPCRG